MASISTPTPLAGSGFFDFCLAAPARSRATVKTGAITLPLLVLFLFPILADLPVAECARGAGGGGRKAKGPASAGGSAAGGDADSPPPPSSPDGSAEGGGGGGGGGSGHGGGAGGGGGGGVGGGGGNPHDGSVDDDDDDPADSDDDDYAPGDGRVAPYRSAFAYTEIRRVRNVRPVIRGFFLPPEGEAHTKNPHPFDVVGDTRYIKVQAKLSGKPAHEL